jgi:RNA polymerase sigma-70 factor (ECF subfamily)
MAGTSSHDELRFSRLAEHLRAGDATTETLVVRRFTVQLVAQARRHMAQRIQQKSSPEDVVQSTFRSFFKRLRRGQFDFESWDGLWSLLVLITVRKCAGRQEHFLAARRDVRREVPLSTASGDGDLLYMALSRGPRPEEAVTLIELVEQLLRGLSDSEQQIVHLRLEGYKIAEICEILGRADRTVRRVLARVRRRALRLTTTEDEESLRRPRRRAEHKP